jgi:predicted acylesterase/phospholipase RssA
MWLALGSAAAVAQRWREFLAAGLMPRLPDVRLTETVSSRDNLLLQFARRLKRSAVVALALGRTSLVTHEEFERRLAFLLPDLQIEKLRLPFAAVTTDFENGRPVSLRRGRLLVAVAASSAVPAVVLPYVLDGRALTDGGTVSDVPVAQARELVARPVVAVATGERWPEDDPEAITIPRAMVRGANMTHQALRELQLQEADLVISPRSAASTGPSSAATRRRWRPGGQPPSGPCTACGRSASVATPGKRRAGAQAHERCGDEWVPLLVPRRTPLQRRGRHEPRQQRRYVTPETARRL